MDKIQNALWDRDGSQVNLSFDMQKVLDEEERIVIGFATLDNVDLTDDIVLSEASMKAFSRFRGNVRLQHSKSDPVGRVVSFQPATYYDEETQKEYSGIQVAVYISKGAEDVWQMCLDGTLTGFSIGGAVLKTSEIYREDINKKVKVIEDYVLLELSIVDSPANHLANIQIVKALDGMDDISKSYETLNLFWCGIDRVAARSNDAKHMCLDCGENMAHMGSIQRNEDIKTQLHKVLSELQIDMEGGQSQVTDTTLTIEKGAEGEAAQAVVSEVSVTEGSQPVVEENASDETEAEEVEPVEEVVEETTEEEEETENASDEIKDLLEALARKLEETSEAVNKDNSGLREEVENISKSLNSKFDELQARQEAFEKSQDELKEKINSAASDIEETQKRLDAVSDGTAMQKSKDSIRTTQTESTKSPFAGLFSGNIEA